MTQSIEIDFVVNSMYYILISYNIEMTALSLNAN